MHFSGAQRQPLGELIQTGFERVDGTDQAVEATREQREMVEGRTDEPPRPLGYDRREAARPGPEADRPTVAGEKVQEPDKNGEAGQPANQEGAGSAPGKEEA